MGRAIPYQLCQRADLQARRCGTQPEPGQAEREHCNHRHPLQHHSRQQPRHCRACRLDSAAQRQQLTGQGRRLRQLLPVAGLGGWLGGLLLLHTDSRLFDQLVPWLILSGSLLLAIQGRVRAWVVARSAMSCSTCSRSP